MVNVSHEELAETKSQPLPSNATLEALKQMRETMCSSSSSQEFKLQANQRFLRRVLSPESPTRNLLLVHGTGVGKCHGINTKILMFDGSVKLVQDIVEGDLLMGDDSTPRSVLSLARGRDQMYEISSTKGTKYSVNSEHILCLKYTGQDDITQIEVKDFLKLSKKVQRNLKGYKVPIDFTPQKIDFDPYILGVWLGDGSKRDPVISSQDSQILSYLREFCKNNNACLTFQSGYDYRISAISKNYDNIFLEFLKKYDLINNKHVPNIYKYNCRNVRLQVLAGLIDTDGYLINTVYEITQKSEQLANDIVFLARSLGFGTTTILAKKSCTYNGNKRVGYYYRTNIFGYIDEIPVKILIKKSEPRYHNKDPLKYGITVTSLGEGDYYGFVLDGNHRYVLDDFSVTHNTCTAIQIAEEYIIRPEFQDKRVLVLANPSIQENFKTQIFDISRVSIDEDGLLLSKQCTGRRYLDMIQRSQSESLKYTDKASQQRVMNLANKIIGEFYEFVGYFTFANMIDRQKLIAKTDNDMKKWIHDTFDNRLIIIDEAHNLKETTESESNKLVAIAIEQIVKTANGVTLVLLTATPMYDKFDEILYYFNLFLWNERKLELNKLLKTSELFTEAGEFKEGQESVFRALCQEYVSFVRGENPFTFPFRLPPPNNLVALPDRKTDIVGEVIKKQRKYLTLTKSFVSPLQKDAIKNLTVKAVSDSRLICVYPENKTFRETFERIEGGYKYRGEKFLAPSKVALYSSKFGLIAKTIEASSGIVFVYSNVVESGAQLFAMCLEEHGYEPMSGIQLLKETSKEVTRGSKGKYVLFTSDISDSDIKKALIRLKRQENADGTDIRVVIASPKVSEGVDFRNVRQIHVLDPWFNMSRIEQVLGRGMRTCSHSSLDFEEQNCTVYLHVCRYPDSEQETVDEYIYRVFVEEKAVRIAKVKRVVMESAMDCELQDSINSLPTQWRDELIIPQKRDQDKEIIRLPLSGMAAPTFEEGSHQIICNVTPSEVDPNHERPLSAILDVKDEILDKVLKLFAKKPIWKEEDLFNHESMKQYTKQVLSYILQSAIDSGFQLKDKNGRIGHLQSKKGVFAFTIGEHDTLLDRLLKEDKGVNVELPVFTPIEATEAPLQKPSSLQIGFLDLTEKREAYPWPSHIKDHFDPEVLDWYIVDNVLTETEKIDHLLNVNWSAPPIYAAPLLATVSDGSNLYVLGSKKIYNAAKENINPVGAEEDAYRAWLKRAKQRFISKKTDLFATMKDGGIIFNMDEKATDVKRAARAKNIGGRQCTTYTAGLLDKFSEWLVGTGFPEEVKTKKDRCLFLDLLVRKSILSGKDGLFWITPEEYSIFSEDENRPDILKQLKDD